MSNQIQTEIHVDLDNRDKKTALFRVFLVVPAVIFISSFSEFSGDFMGIIGGFLVLPVVLSLFFRNVYPSYVLAFNKALLELSNRINAYALVLTDDYPSIEMNPKVRLIYLIAWISVVKNGVYPEDKAEEVVKVIAYWNRLYGYSLLLVTDEYPSFSL